MNSWKLDRFNISHKFKKIKFSIVWTTKSLVTVVHLFTQVEQLAHQKLSWSAMIITPGSLMQPLKGLTSIHLKNKEMEEFFHFCLWVMSHHNLLILWFVLKWEQAYSLPIQVLFKEILLNSFLLQNRNNFF